jgi:hypothetical protein
LLCWGAKLEQTAKSEEPEEEEEEEEEAILLFKSATAQ